MSHRWFCPSCQGTERCAWTCGPKDGAFHQIRAQLGAWGHTIKGDVKYGARRGEKDGSIALHARSLRFTHPITDAPMLIEAPAPDEKLWAALAASIAG